MLRLNLKQRTVLAAACLNLAAMPLSHAAQDAAVAAKPAAAGPAANKAYMASDAAQQVSEATAVVKRMSADPQLKKLLAQAKGVFIVPTYGRGGWGLGVRGGEGVMLAQTDGKWSGPVFYNIAGVSVGLQAGLEAGALVMLLMNEKALNGFMNDNNFSLAAGAGLTFLSYDAKAQVDAGRGDVIVWADTKGAFANATVGLTDILFDASDTQAFYKRPSTAKEVLGGGVKSQEAAALQQALAAGK